MITAKIEKDTLCYRPLVRVSAKVEKTPFVVGLWSGLGRKHKIQFVIGLWLGLGLECVLMLMISTIETYF